MMKKLSITQLQPAEVLEITSRFQSAITDAGLVDPFVDRITDLLEDDKLVLQRAIAAIRTNSYIEDVSEADDLRDDLYVSFRDMVAAYRRRKSTDMQEAYTTLWPILEQAGTKLHRLGYTQQSGRMQVLFVELDKAEPQQALDTLGLLDLYNELKQSQEDFLSVYTERLEEDARRDYPTLREARRKIFPHLNMLIGTIGILSETDGKSWQPVADQFNTITTEVMSVAAARRTRKEEEVPVPVVPAIG